MLQICHLETYQKDASVKLLQGAGNGEGSRPSAEIYAKIIKKKKVILRAFWSVFKTNPQQTISSNILTSNTV